MYETFKRITLLLGLGVILGACSEEAPKLPVKHAEAPVSLGKTGDEQPKAGARGGLESSGGKLSQLTVYKTPSCGCCSAWVDHVQAGGFATDVVEQESVAHIKDRFGIPANARSCHTALSDEGLVFEGHVPARYIQEFLLQRQEGAVGLIVPAMPLGSPGMEVEDHFTPYTIFAMNDQGVLSPYARMTKYRDQF